jgi:hypothetical protein
MRNKNSKILNWLYEQRPFWEADSRLTEQKYTIFYRVWNSLLFLQKRAIGPHTEQTSPLHSPFLTIHINVILSRLVDLPRDCCLSL